MNEIRKINSNLFLAISSVSIHRSCSASLSRACKKCVTKDTVAAATTTRTPFTDIATPAIGNNNNNKMYVCGWSKRKIVCYFQFNRGYCCNRYCVAPIFFHLYFYVYSVNSWNAPAVAVCVCVYLFVTHRRTLDFHNELPFSSFSFIYVQLTVHGLLPIVQPFFLKTTISKPLKLL